MQVQQDLLCRPLGAMISCKGGCVVQDPTPPVVKVEMPPEPPPPPHATPEELEAEEQQRHKEVEAQWLASKELEQKRAEEQRRREEEAERQRRREEEEARRRDEARRAEEERRRIAEAEAEARRKAEAARLERERKRKVAVAAWLAKNGFTDDVNTPKKTYLKSKYPIHTAAKQGNIEITEMLIEEGANRAQPDSKGKTALQIARLKNTNGSHDGVLEVLQRPGDRVN